jgi:hypothetical protein
MTGQLLASGLERVKKNQQIARRWASRLGSRPFSLKQNIDPTGICH